jgi:predicted PurR-regulated permease PerM
MLDDLSKILRHKHHHHGHGHYAHLFDLAKRLLQNRTFIIGALTVFLIFCAVMILLVIMLIPLLNKIISVVDKQGIKGVPEVINSFLLKIWEGSGKQ